MPGSHQQGLIYSKINSNQRRVKPTLKGVNPVQLSSFFITTNRYRVRITADAAQIHLSISHSILPSLVDKTQGYLIQTILDSLHDFILRRFPWSCITDFNFRKDHYFLAILGYIWQWTVHLPIYDVNHVHVSFLWADVSLAEYDDLRMLLEQGS